MKIQKQLLTLASCSLLSLSSMADKVDDFNQSWLGETLQFQRDIAISTPLADSSMFGTHNSYNSKKYQAFDRYIDPNQQISILDQLRMGSRFVELDVHWTAKFESFAKRLLLCHSGIGVDLGEIHLGCGLRDRYLDEGLKEIRTFLDDPKNAGEVVILYFEDHMEGQYDRFYKTLNNTLGNKIYRSNGCQEIPSTLTPEQVLSAGKQIVIIKDNADHRDESSCESHANIENTVYTWFGGIKRDYEDTTTVAELFGDPKFIESSEEVKSLFESGTNLIAFDQLEIDDHRLAGAAWSWDTNQPNDWQGQDCAEQGPNGRWGDASCQLALPYACNDGNQWKIAGNGTWQGGNSACDSLSGNYTFSAPTNAVDNIKLKNAKQGNDNVWLNVNDLAQEGEWSRNPYRPTLTGANRYYEPVMEKACNYHQKIASFDGANCYLFEKSDNASYWSIGSNQYYSKISGDNPCPYNGASFDGANCLIYKKQPGVDYWSIGNKQYYSPQQQLTCPTHNAWFDGANCRMFSKVIGLDYWSYQDNYYYSAPANNQCNYHDSWFDGANCRIYDEQSLNYFDY